MSKDARIALRLSDELRDALLAVAERESRTLSQVVELILIGDLPPVKRPATRAASPPRRRSK